MHQSKEGDQTAFQKPPFDSFNYNMPTAIGNVKIRGPVSPDQLTKYRLADGLCCFRTPCKQHKALIDLAHQPDGLLFTASLANIIVSYISFQKPDYPWWQKRCFDQLYELGSIETDLGWRKMGLAKSLLNSLFKNPDFDYFENYIVMAGQFVQSWDLKNTNMSPWAYREMMINLFKEYNFKTWETIDPEIREHPCNLLLARIGSKITPDRIKHFSSCCLDMI